MKINGKVKLLCIMTVAVIATVVSIAIPNFKADARQMLDFRPSVAINHDIEQWTNTINNHQQSIQFLENLIYDYENNKEDFSQNIEDNQARFNYLHDYINNNRENIEDLTKISYASYFAKKLLEDVVGSDIATNTIFKWGIVDFIMSFEDESIIQLIDDYYDAKDNLDNAISAEQKAEEMYNNAKVDLEKCKSEIPAMQSSIDYWQALLPEIYEIESEYGEAGESYLCGDGYFSCPLESYTVSGSFGEAREGYYHKGVDMCTGTGSPIYAAADGDVIESGENPTMGNYIKFVTDEGYVVTYMHCSHLFVPSGVRIHRGDNVALVGSTGDSSGPHLHFQVEIGGSPVDPFDYM